MLSVCPWPTHFGRIDGSDFVLDRWMKRTPHYSMQEAAQTRLTRDPHILLTASQNAQTRIAKQTYGARIHR